MTKTETRIAVIKDVLKQLRYTSFRAGVYITNKKGDANVCTMGELYSKYNGKELQPLIPKVRKNCEVCALGGLFLSTVAVDNKCILNTNYIFEQKRLEDIFTKHQLGLIESAFEKMNMCTTRINPTKAIEFGKRYDSPKARMKAICENILANKGMFRP